MTPEEYYKEVVKLDMDKFDKKAPKFDYYDLIDFADSYHKKQLTLTDVVASLLCVDSEGLSFIMEGETYNLLEESDTLYKIADDDGDEFWYDKKHFVKNKK
tara:strand:- start:19 stop:321 length:303 start_codon:yes stop_codon:yes gene_type:complete